MKNRIIMFAMATIAAIGMISCGNPANPDSNISNTTTTVETITIENAESYVVKLGEYKNLDVAVDLEELTDEMLDYYTDYFFSMDAQSITDFAAREGDTVIIDYVGKIDGIAFSGGTATGAELLLGSHSYITGFEEGLVGVVAGESRTLNLVFPEDYYEEYAGKDVVFEVTVQYVVPAFDDAGVSLLNSENYTTVAEYKYFVEQALNEYVQEDNNNAIVQAALTQVIDSSEFAEFPAEFLDQQQAIVVNQFLDTANSYGIDVATYLNYCGTSVEELTALYAKQQVIFYVICNKEGLYPTEQDIADNAALFADYYGYDSVDAFYAENSKDDFINTLIGSNVFEYLLGTTAVNTAE